MTEPDLKLTPATPEDLADSLSFALRFEGRKSQHDSDRLNADIVAKRLVRYLDKAGYVVMKKPPLEGHSGGAGVWSEVTCRSSGRTQRCRSPLLFHLASFVFRFAGFGH
jgi:hypothetical protein